MANWNTAAHKRRLLDIMKRQNPQELGVYELNDVCECMDSSGAFSILMVKSKHFCEISILVWFGSPQLLIAPQTVLTGHWSFSLCSTNLESGLIPDQMYLYLLALIINSLIYL